MLQPAYVFIIFVLKRNVFKIILCKDKKRQTLTGKGKRITLKESKRSTLTTNLASDSGQQIEMQPIMEN